jgi:hypothetical protein
MRQKLCRRLEQLEKASVVAPDTEPIYDSRQMDELWERVEAWHAVPENQAWVAAQPPESLGIQVQQLRAELLARASGRTLPA